MKLIRLTLVVAAVTCLQESAVRGQDPVQEPEKKVVLPEGTQAFRNLVLHQEFNLTPLKTLQELSERQPEETMLIVFGDTAVLDRIRKQNGSLEKFRADGGAILIASDRDDRGRLQEWKLRITGGVVTDDGRLCYKGNEHCPKISKPLASNHAVFQNINQGVATNMPSVVQSWQSDFKVLGVFSLGSRQPGNVFGLGAFLVAKDRMLVMGGHSVFMNVLLAQPDIDNYQFARNCVRWLSEGKRKYVLFVEEGRIVDRFDVGLAVSPPLPIPPTEVLNRLLRGLEDESFFHRLLYRVLGPDYRNRILRTFLLLVTLVLLLYGCKRVIGARHRIEAAVPLLSPLPSPVPAVELSLAAQRQQAVLKGGDFRAPSRELARLLFEELAPMPTPAHVHSGREPHLPLFASSGNWFERHWLAKQIPYLWQLAYGNPGRISKRQFCRLPTILDRLAHAYHAGRFHWLAQEFS